MIRVCHVIDGLDVGGAEVMLENLVRTTDPSRFTSEVVSLTDIGPVGERIQRLGVPVRELGLTPGPAGALRALRVPGSLRVNRPDVVQTWLYHADLLGGVGAKLGIRRPPVVWGLHRSDLDTEWTKPRLAVAARLAARISARVPDRIVCCSHDAARRHIELGYDPGRMVVIPNGFELSAYAPDDEARRSVRAELGIPLDAPAVGMVARLDPQKDHGTFLDAAARVLRRMPTAHFILCGRGVDRTDAVFRGLASRHPELDGHLHALGLRSDVARLDASFDVFALSSIGGEAFPLAIGEAMAAGVPCVATDVGDVAEMIGDTGRVVARNDPAALAEGLLGLLSMPSDERRELGLRARERIRDRYSLRSVVALYEQIYEGLVA